MELTIKEKDYYLEYLDNYNFVVYHKDFKKELHKRDIYVHSGISYHSNLGRALKKIYYRLTKSISTEFFKDYNNVLPSTEEDIQRKARVSLTKALKNKTTKKESLDKDKVIDLF